MLEINSMINTHLAQFRQNTFKIKNNVDNFIPAHAAIIRAFESGDALMGEKKMRQHMKKVSKDLETSKYHT
jgi:GntR family transcriptional repressor for pyruvate dehydrogenase complex